MPRDVFVLNIHLTRNAPEKFSGLFEKRARYFLPALCHQRNHNMLSRALYEHSLQLQYIILAYLFLEADTEVHYCKEKKTLWSRKSENSLHYKASKSFQSSTILILAKAREWYSIQFSVILMRFIWLFLLPNLDHGRICFYPSVSETTTFEAGFPEQLPLSFPMKFSVIVRCIVIKSISTIPFVCNVKQWINTIHMYILHWTTQTDLPNVLIAA